MLSYKWGIDENMGTNLQAFYKHFYIACLKTQKQQLRFVKIKNKVIFFFFLIQTARVNRAGRKPVRAGRSTLRNRPSWNTIIAITMAAFRHGWIVIVKFVNWLSSINLIELINVLPGVINKCN